MHCAAEWTHHSNRATGGVTPGSSQSAPGTSLCPAPPSTTSRFKQGWKGLWCLDGKGSSATFDLVSDRVSGPLGGPTSVWTEDIRHCSKSLTHSHSPPNAALSSTAISLLVCWCAFARAATSVTGYLLVLRLQKAVGGCCRAFGFLWILHSMQFGLKPHSGREIVYVTGFLEMIFFFVPAGNKVAKVILFTMLECTILVSAPLSLLSLPVYFDFFFFPGMRGSVFPKTFDFFFSLFGKEALRYHLEDLNLGSE